MGWYHHPLTQHVFYGKKILYYSMIVVVILYCIAGVFDAIMDTLSDHFSVSVFKGLNPSYWSKNVSWVNKYVDGDVSKGYKRVWGIIIPAAFTDAWHLCKSLKEVFNCAAIAAAAYIPIDNIFILFIAAGFLRNVVFVLFYDIFLVDKK